MVSTFLNQKDCNKFGPFLGVFTPSVLTILGVIMYLRFGWVVAHAGLLGSVAIVLICTMIALITSLSASAVATNSPLGTGGEYYMISRSLGLTIGGAIGIPLFLCYVLSITLYSFGLAEALSIFWPLAWGSPPLQWITAVLLVLIIAIAAKSARATLTLQVPLMILVGLSILALTIGVLKGPLKAPQWSPLPANLESAGGFWAILAVFFPAVTGFSAGIGMSGDLKDPQKAIPKGTILAVTVGGLIYLTIPFLLSITDLVGTNQLAQINPKAPPVWTRIALFGPILIYPGLWGAILSSAFGSALAGPRVLQALAKDGLVPKFIGRMSKTGQPTIATLIGGLIALSAVAMGSLNKVAQLVTVLFLTLYLIENLVATVENLVRDPSYRPTLKIHWSISLLGVCGIIVVMFLISVKASLLAIGFEALIWLYLRRKNLVATWGGVWAGVWGSLARLSLYKLAHQVSAPRSWRPNILLFSDRIQEKVGQVRMSGWFNQNNGILTVCDIMPGQPEKDVEAAQQRENEMARFLESEGIVAFSEVDIMDDFESGVLSVIQANGMGSLRANTIAFGWPNRPERLQAMLRIIRKIAHIGKASLIIRPQPLTGPSRFDRIDIWWRGKFNNGDLMLLMAYLITLAPKWRNANLYLRSIVTNDTTQPDIEESLTTLIDTVRIKATQDVIVLPEDKSVVEVMHETSKDADIVFVGMMTPEEGQETEYATRLIQLVEKMPSTVLVRNSGPFEGQLL
jgi:amino acid transporter